MEKVRPAPASREKRTPSKPAATELVVDRSGASYKMIAEAAEKAKAGLGVRANAMSRAEFLAAMSKP